jgi:hypothetical protein
MKITYKHCFSYQVAAGGYNHIPQSHSFPTPPIGRIIREGTEGDCPHCHSTTGYRGKIFGLLPNGPLGILGKYVSSNVKKYCINKECMYHYFDIRKNSKRFHINIEILEFVKIREREAKFERIVK